MILPSLLSFLALVAAMKDCQAPPQSPGTYQNYTIHSSNIRRKYILFLPSNYGQSASAPLILNFPGHGDSDDYQRTLTLMDETSFNTDYIIVYPQGSRGTHGKSSWAGAPYAKTSVDDIAFTADLLDHLEDTLCIDTTRIYATGKSNGGGFVNYLACHPISARFAAFAPVAGAFYEGFGADGPACQPARSPQPILEIHGYNDSLISYFGDPSHHGGALPKITDWASDWAIRNGCSDGEGPSATPEVDGKVIHYSYPCHTHHYAVYGADHVWESTIGNADTERYEYGPSPINATSKIIDFFNKIQLPSDLARNLQSAQPSSLRDL